jgi:aminopeptidase N
MTDVTDNKKLFGAVSFDKGAWVLHMLRHVMGDPRFFAAVRAYVAEYQYRNVTTEDFRAVCERLYGKTLDWFFREWIYGPSRPGYRVSWTGGSEPAFVVRQVQPDAPAFTMPIDVSITTSAGVTRLVVWNDRKEQRFPLASAGKRGDGEIIQVTLDPDGWILKDAVGEAASGAGDGK